MAPAIAAGFGATIFMLIKMTVHVRKNPVPWAVYSSPFFFLIAGTICTLSIVYKGSPNLGLKNKPVWYIVSVTMGCGWGLALLAALFFVPYVRARVIKKDASVKGWMFIYGPALLNRPVHESAEKASVPDYAVVQDEEEDDKKSEYSQSDNGMMSKNPETTEKAMSSPNSPQILAASPELSYQELQAQSDYKLKQRLLKKRGPMGWAMRTLENNPMGAGQIYEIHNMKTFFRRLPAMITVGLLYGFHYDIHAAQSGISGTPEGLRMQRVYAAAEKYPNEVEHTYSFVQVLTACTASFAHGANDIGNSVGPWAVIYSAWSTGDAAKSKATVPVWQLAVLSATISLGLITYGYNIMKGKLVLNSTSS